MNIKKGRVAIVTGAGQGIGKGVAMRLAEAGARVVVSDINEETAYLVAEDIQNQGYEAMPYTFDVGNKAMCEKVVAATMEKWGGVDILVNNAGIIRDAMLSKMTEDKWEMVQKINLKGVFLMMQSVYAAMREQNFGRIINMSSSSCKGNIGQGNYSAAKAGVNGLTYTAALEFAKYGITVNSICPGVIDTPMVRSIPQKIYDRFIETIPVKRIGKPDDVAAAVIFFASEEAGYITGQTIFVDGGMQTGVKI